MAKGKKTGGRDFEVANKAAVGKGRPLLPEDLKNVKKLKSDEAERLIVKFITMTHDQIVGVFNDPESPYLHKMLCQVMIKAVEQGSVAHLDFLLNRTIGRVLDKVEVSMPKPFMIKRPDGSVLLGAKEGDEDE